MSALWSTRDLVEATGGAMLTDFTASGVSIDTRTLAPGDLFVALRGEAGDGHGFVPDALAKGAAGAMVHRDVTHAARLLRVDDTLAGLTRLGGYARARFTGRVVAVTGSVGKTTTKEMLRQILSAFGPTHAAVASYNNHWGVPLTLARMALDARFCVAEIGMNHAGEIAPLSRLARPHVAVITTVEKAHIGYLGSLAAIAAEKASILQGLEPDGVAILPIDSPMFSLLREAAGAARIVTFGSNPQADACLLAAESDATGSDLRVRVSGTETALRIEAPGRHMAMNALAALAASAAMGADVRAAADALAGIAAVTGRGLRREIAVPGGSALLLDESYNGNGASMRAALEVLRLQPVRRRIAVLGDMLELGEEGPAEHVALAGPVIEAADLLFACGPLSRQLFDAVPERSRGAHAADSAALAPVVARAVRAGDAVLVKGSLGSRMKRVVEALDGLGSAG
ncbi:MAG TPA: UDP-N-acetylmuramoyl-tripeptide--D-alanyl-D-alanine ligase [Acetobacteraceae bacterium]|jgi:UDP-N-acetylmuramoyl-tripeptide--D-alanyl-D-alanine ligase|nr:UDP-N-acetylmuramoyl-tripeptide--D-alanyl-D-alanine ligase [Acetobacteraceae bacterium]